MPLTTQARADLLAALQPQVAAIAEDLRLRLLRPTTPAEQAGRAAAQALHGEEAVGDELDVWLDLLAHRAAVFWVLKLIYVRVLEDRGLIHARIVNHNHQDLFARIAPNLGDSAYLRWVFTDLAQPHGGLPELFAPQPAEVLAPADAHSTALLALLRAKGEDRSRPRFDFADERFDGQLLGDLYQELDPVVKERFALLQTPAFVRAFMLDRTLSAALAAHPADAVRLIDPACGSGHFLIDALRRLHAATAAQHPDWAPEAVVQSALSRVVGLDLNDYAAALARARLIMTALELSGAASLAAASRFHPHVYWADGLEQIDKGVDDRGTQLKLGERAEDRPRSTMTPLATREALWPVLRDGFHVVVANPPYITEKDEAKKAYHKEKSGKPKRQRYLSATGKYGLGAVFTERCFQLAQRGGYVALITSNAFAKREYGVAVVEEVLAKVDVQLLIDTSGAYIPGHGTPTLILMGQNRPPQGATFNAVLGKRGEPTTPEAPEQGRVWSDILAGWDRPGFDSPYVSTESVRRDVFAKHPWSLRGGGALALQLTLHDRASSLLSAHVVEMGFDAITGADEVFLADTATWARRGVHSTWTRVLVEGESIRDWATTSETIAGYPYVGILAPDTLPVPLHQFLWRFSGILRDRVQFGKTAIQAGLKWFEYRSFYTSKRFSNDLIGFAFVATHNQFVLDRGGKVFNRTAPVIKLPAEATEEDHLALLGVLNSSAACFWMKQAFFCKGYGASGAGGRTTAAPWEDFWEHDSTKLARFPLPPQRDETLPYAQALDALGQARAADTVAAALAEPGGSSPSALRARLDARRARDLDRLAQMVGLQEELDWKVYALYGLCALPVVAAAAAPPLQPGQRPFELTLAQATAEAQAAQARGAVPVEAPTAWFSRHGWQPQTALPAEAPADLVARVAARRAATAKSAALQLLEAPVHKRRWYLPAFADDEREGLRRFLLDHIEAALAPLPEPSTPRALARRLAADPRWVAAAALYAGAEAPDLGALCATLMAAEAVAAHPLHRYTAKGLVKRREWEKTWALQAREDRGEAVTIKVPPKYTAADFVGATAYGLRGPLDVPKERFVAHSEVPTAAGKRRPGEEALYGWAGWSRADRLGRLFALLETLDDQGVPAAERVALHDLMFRYAAELARTAPQKAQELRDDLKADAGAEPGGPQLEGWLALHPATKGW